MSEAEESGQERLKRNFNELLQELRVAQAGVQILFGFLLSIVFTDRYQSVAQYVRVTHLITILFAAAAVALLTAPAAWHRVLFRRGRREDIIEVAHRFMLVGLACLAAAMTGTVLLLGEVIVGGWIAVVFGVVAGLGFAALWFVVPWLERYRDTIDSDGHPDSSVTV
jgi:predicted membrane channel-forming protein YqfA (hemolysin III family)